MESAREKIFTAKSSVSPSKMRIDLYATCWNEERIIPFFLRHYEPIVDRIVIFDDGSTDRSLELLATSPKVELRQLAPGSSYVLQQMEELNRCWKESRGRADWVITCDMDEQIYHHRDLRDYLERCKNAGVTILNPVGVDMVSTDFPPPDSTLTETVRLCVRTFLQDKFAVFDPNAIDEINYTPGRHVAKSLGRLIFPEKREVKLLHYKNLSLAYVRWRSKELENRNTDFDRERGWNLHHHRPPDDIRIHFEKMLNEAMDISLIGKKRPASLQPDESQRKL